MKGLFTSTLQLTFSHIKHIMLFGTTTYIYFKNSIVKYMKVKFSKKLMFVHVVNLVSIHYYLGIPIFMDFEGTDLPQV